MSLRATFRYVSAASAITAAASATAQPLEFRTASQILGEPFPEVLVRIQNAHTDIVRRKFIEDLIARVSDYGYPLVQDSTVCFLYHGPATRVTIPSDLNGWNPSADSLKRVTGTDLFYLEKTIGEAARFEYKIVVDSTWMLDPLNRQTAIGGYGPNSEVWMARYHPTRDILYKDDIPHGRIDTLSFNSKALGRTHPVFVYLPPGYKNSRRKLPVIWVMDGGEYLTLGLMNNVLDNLIADNRISPVMAVFIDPRTDIRDSGTSMRMHYYTMSDTFVTALTTELRPRLLKTYRISEEPTRNAIMGASLGGLIATYAGFTKPEVFGSVAAQSPSFWWRNEAMIQMFGLAQRKNLRFYVDTGTIRDAQEESRKMKRILTEKGYEVLYAEYPEGHNWVNWRARLDEILVWFVGN